MILILEGTTKLLYKDLFWPPIFQSTNQPVLTSIDWLKPVLTTGPINTHIDWSFANLEKQYIPPLPLGCGGGGHNFNLSFTNVKIYFTSIKLSLIWKVGWKQTFSEKIASWAFVLRQTGLEEVLNKMSSLIRFYTICHCTFFWTYYYGKITLLKF